MDGSPRKSPFQRSLVVDRDSAITFMKSVGFVETADADVFTRDSERSAAQKAAGAHVFTTVNVQALIANAKAWRLFVTRWTRKLAQKKTP